MNKKPKKKTIMQRKMEIKINIFKKKQTNKKKTQWKSSWMAGDSFSHSHFYSMQLCSFWFSSVSFRFPSVFGPSHMFLSFYSFDFDSIPFISHTHTFTNISRMIGTVEFIRHNQEYTQSHVNIEDVLFPPMLDVWSVRGCLAIIHRKLWFFMQFL